jgi:hypothetical protein
MENLFISYSQAVKLKELGFDEPCIKIQFDETQYEFKINKGKNYTNTIVQDMANQNDWVTVPLKQQAFNWFRDKHELVVNWLYDQHDNYGSYIGVSIKNVHFEETIVGVYKIHEEAESACIDKLIEILKNT